MKKRRVKNLLLINPFDPIQGNGVNSYYDNVRAALFGKMRVVDFANNSNLPIADFQKEVLKFVSATYSQDDVVIEAPETRSPTLLLSRNYKVHVRLHTPLGICQQYAGERVQQNRLSDELRVISQAGAVSAPSYGIVREISKYLDTSNFSVFKNPIKVGFEYRRRELRKYDVVFFGRLQKLKGADYLNSIFSRLPAHYKVALVGEGTDKFEPHGLVSCHVTGFGHVSGEARFEFLRDARVIILPSRFENCSMVLLEALACGCPVVAWKVGGNDEFPTELVRTVPFDEIEPYVAAVIDAVETPIGDNDTSDDHDHDHDHDHNARGNPKVFHDFLSKLNGDFEAGLDHLIDRLEARDPAQSSAPYFSELKPQPAYHSVRRVAPFVVGESFFSGIRIFGFTISNEHIEEMWAPVLHYLGADYKFVCRRPLGFHKKFDRTFPVDPTKFQQFDWIAHPDQLMKEIAAYKPHVLLTHNGSHPAYQHVLQAIKYDIQILRTELGWFPQDGNIYIDRHGVNGASSIARQTFQSLVGSSYSSVFGQGSGMVEKVAQDIFLPAQLPNDTNLIVFSPRFRTIEAFVEHVIAETPAGRKIYLKPHPLDANAARFHSYASESVEIVDARIPASDLLERVGHVAAINSTVLLEALIYPVNIYMGGVSVLSNKGIAFDLIDNDFGDVFQHTLFGTMRDRAALIAAFQGRQIKVADLERRSLAEEGSLPQALSPIVEALLLSAPRWTTSAVAPAANGVTAPAKPAVPIIKSASLPAQPAPAPSLPRDLRPSLQLCANSHRLDDGLISIGAGSPRHGVYGPYLPVDPGSYTLTIELGAKHGLDLFGRGGALAIDVVFDRGERVLVAKKLTTSDLKNGNARQHLEFEVPPGPRRSIEVRVWTDGKRDLVLKEAVLARLFSA